MSAVKQIAIPRMKRRYVRRASLEDTIQSEAKKLSNNSIALKSKETYRLNLNSAMQKVMIQNAEKMIAQNRATQERMKPEYEEKRLFFEQVKTEWEALKTQWEAIDEDCETQENIIKVMKGFVVKDVPNKELHVVGKKDRKKTEGYVAYVKWTDEVVNVLQAKNKFMSLDELWEEFRKNKAIVDAANRTKTGFERLKAVTYASLHNHATRRINPGAQGKRAARLFIEYKDKFGLTNWVGKDGVPLDPKHMEQFVYA